jgi:hypothetical protein
MPRKLLADIFEELEPQDAEDKAMGLCANNSLALRQLLTAALDPAVEFDVEIPEYRENTEVDGYASNSLMIEFKRLYIFMKQSAVKPKRRVEILAQILESIDPKDAQLLVKVLNKDLSEYGITAEIVNQAFPGLIKNLPAKKEAPVATKK